ncbi:hypothetical protein ACFFKU_03885 [Kineococcus gynurae]|uniref:DUF317 domain-containing protein n=1 Tax=Kineococcus gynurae TaxID=452979 RepID=A0ABV5LRN9_9ACTN
MGESFAGLRPVEDPDAVGGGIAPRTGGLGSSVTDVVPRGFPAYARILHPVDLGGDEEPGTWAGVAARTGRVVHALAQWRSIVTPVAGQDLPVGPEGRWADVQVREGHLEPEALRAVLSVLAPFTGDQECVLGMWEGWGWLHGSTGVRYTSGGKGSPPPPLARPPIPDVVNAATSYPHLHLPGRDYLLFQGPLDAALRTGKQITPDWFDPQSPSLVWPLDRSWFLASEIDFDSTLLAGSAELVAALLAAPGIEA